MTPLKLKRKDIDLLIDALNHRHRYWANKIYAGGSPLECKKEQDKGDELILLLENLKTPKAKGNGS